ncbi:MAG: ribosomal-protein-alanine N-acetyltransferase [Arenicella sp.]|jgi:ribosomal-protein-alanine N-acetyltransferase
MSRDRENLLSAAKQGGLAVRDMQSQDLKQVLAIELNAQASPWGRLSFEESLTKQHRCRVVEMNAECSMTAIVGYHVACQVIDELHILNVVAAPQFQGLGLGHMLMSDLIEIAEQTHCNRVFLEVRASNEVAQSLYAKWQFKQIALRKEYYRPTSVGQPREDALIFMRQT